MLELADRLEIIDNEIQQAAHSVDTDKSISDSTRKAVERLRLKSEELLRELNQENSNEQTLIDGVMELEDDADQARDAAKVDLQKRSIKNETFDRILAAHNSASQLKHEITGSSNP